MELRGTRFGALGLLLLLVLGATPSAAQLAAGLHTFEIEFAGLTRSYDVYVPASYRGKPAPLVLDFHGWGSSKESQRAMSGFDRAADAAGFVVAYPQGYGFVPSWNTPVCCGEAHGLELDDVGFAVAVVDAIATATRIDRRRVYATGLSNGGALSHLLACRAANTFAAVAPVSFPLSVETPSDCQPSRGVPVVHLHGLSDTGLPFLSSSYLAPYSAFESFLAWEDIDQCTNAPNMFYLRGGFCAVANGCRDGAITVLCGVQGSHALYMNPAAFPVAAVAWSFLSRFSTPQPAVQTFMTERMP